MNEGVIDAGPLVHLFQADALHLLDEFERVSIPETVLEEVGDEVLDATEDLGQTVVEVEPSDDGYPTLDPGETAAIDLASEGGSILLTDYLAAREVASELGVEVHGSIARDDCSPRRLVEDYSLNGLQLKACSWRRSRRYSNTCNSRDLKTEQRTSRTRGDPRTSSRTGWIRRRPGTGIGRGRRSSTGPIPPRRNSGGGPSRRSRSTSRSRPGADADRRARRRSWSASPSGYSFDTSPVGRAGRRGVRAGKRGGPTGEPVAESEHLSCVLR